MKNFNNYFLNESNDIEFKYVFKVKKGEYNDFYNKLIEKSEELELKVKIRKGEGVSTISGLLSIMGDKDNVIILVDWIKENTLKIK
jgi:hypothetical protein